jgi:hypothetical protein
MDGEYTILLEVSIEKLLSFNSLPGELEAPFKVN